MHIFFFAAHALLRIGFVAAIAGRGGRTLSVSRSSRMHCRSSATHYVLIALPPLLMQCAYTFPPILWQILPCPAFSSRSPRRTNRCTGTYSSHRKRRKAGRGPPLRGSSRVIRRFGKDVQRRALRLITVSFPRRTGCRRISRKRRCRGGGITRAEI